MLILDHILVKVAGRMTSCEAVSQTGDISVVSIRSILTRGAHLIQINPGS